jgi:hypothetical protein
MGQRFCSNRVSTTKYSMLSFIPYFIFEQFTRFYILFYILITVLEVIQINLLPCPSAWHLIFYILGALRVKIGTVCLIVSKNQNSLLILPKCKPN